MLGKTCFELQLSWVCHADTNKKNRPKATSLIREREKDEEEGMADPYLLIKLSPLG